MTYSKQAATRFAAIKEELDETRSDFMALLNAIPEDDWDGNLPDRVWTMKDELVHIVQALEVLPKGINRAIHGGRRSVLSFIPSGLRGWVNGYIIIPMRSKRATKQSITEGFEQAMSALLEIFENLPEDAWDKGAAYPRQYRTIEQMAHRPKEHFEEHAASLRRTCCKWFSAEL